MTEARRQYNKEYYLEHKPEMAKRKAWKQKHDLDYRLRSILRTIIQRCEDPRHATYKWYGGKGIKNFLTLEDLEVLWDRDGAALMAKPSVDRRESDDHYTFDNCRFMELAANQKRWERKREGKAA